jgi:hypothetical protein
MFLNASLTEFFIVKLVVLSFLRYEYSLSNGAEDNFEKNRGIIIVIRI